MDEVLNPQEKVREIQEYIHERWQDEPLDLDGEYILFLLTQLEEKAEALNKMGAKFEELLDENARLKQEIKIHVG